VEKMKKIKDNFVIIIVILVAAAFFIVPTLYDFFYTQRTGWDFSFENIFRLLIAIVLTIVGTAAFAWYALHAEEKENQKREYLNKIREEEYAKGFEEGYRKGEWDGQDKGEEIGFRRGYDSAIRDIRERGYKKGKANDDEIEQSSSAEVIIEEFPEEYNGQKKICTYMDLMLIDLNEDAKIVSKLHPKEEVCFMCNSDDITDDSEDIIACVYHDWDLAVLGHIPKGNVRDQLRKYLNNGDPVIARISERSTDQSPFIDIALYDPSAYPY